MGHAVAGMLRILATYGATVLKRRDCRELRITLRDVQFKRGQARNERLTAEQANEIRAMAHKMGRPSIALAQAFQFECPLKQKDVIGEWVPVTEEGPSDLIHDGKKWLRGLRWEEIDQDWLLRHTTSWGGKDIQVDLQQKPMVMEELGEELARLGKRPQRVGPVIVCEFSKVPWTTHEFRRWWRKVADACGIPKNVRNMDTRTDDQRQGPTGVLRSKNENRPL